MAMITYLDNLHNTLDILCLRVCSKKMVFASLDRPSPIILYYYDTKSFHDQSKEPEMLCSGELKKILYNFHIRHLA